MKLKSECVREVLLALESCGMDECMDIESLSKRMPRFDADDIRYTCLKLIEAGYIHGVTVKSMGQVHPDVLNVTDITYKGHEFLDTVRSHAVWQKTQKAIEKIGSASLPIVLEIAKTFAIQLITGQQ